MKPVMNKYVILVILSSIMFFFFDHVYADNKQNPIESFNKEQQNLISSIEAYLNSIDSLVAEFIQIAPDGTTSDGTFFLSRPGRVRWQYNPPVPIIIVVNKGKLIYRDYDLDQISHSSADHVVASFLTRQLIRLTGSDVEIIDLNQKDSVTRLTVRQKNKEDQGLLTLIFSDKPMQLKKLEMTDATGQITSVSFRKMKQGEVLDDGLFQIEDPRLYQRKKNG
jgi:outer membrane lipoprotein-sorting protein